MHTYFKLGEEEVVLTTGIYMFTGNTSLNATCDNGEPYGCLTVNLMEPLESPDLAYLNINLFGVDNEKFITQNGLGKKVVGREKQSGFLTYPLYRLNLKKIQETYEHGTFD